MTKALGAGAAAFPSYPEVRPDVPGGFVTIQTAACTKCDHVERFEVRGKGHVPDGAIIKKLKLLGWRVQRDGHRLTCAGCLGRPVTRADNGNAMTQYLQCETDGCPQRLTLPRVGRAVGETAPDSVVIAALKAAGWTTAPGGDHTAAYCAVHGPMVEGFGVTCDHARNPSGALARMIRVCKGDRAKAETAIATARTLAVQFCGSEAALEERLESFRPKAREDTPMTTGGAAAAPREMQVGDRRRITARLTEVYGDNAYTGDMTDTKLAAELAVPVAWVATVRVEGFGDGETNEAALKEARENRRLLHELSRDFKAAQARVDTALASLAEAERLYGPLADRVRKLEAKMGVRADG